MHDRPRLESGRCARRRPAVSPRRRGAHQPQPPVEAAERSRASRRCDGAADQWRDPAPGGAGAGPVSALASRPHGASAGLDRLAESGALDELAWALTGVLLSAAQRLAPEATTPAEAAWIVASRADPRLGPPAEPTDQMKGEPSARLPRNEETALW